MTHGRETPPRAPVPCQPITYLEAVAARRPDAPAVIEGGRWVTFAELVGVAHGLAAAFRPGEVVGVHLPNVWQYLALELAIPLAGAVIMPLPLALGAAELAWARERSGATRVIDLEEAERLVAGTPRGARASVPQPDPGRVVEIALTSGTTGLPKLASLNAGLKQATFEAFTSRLEVGEEDRVLPLSPLTQGIGGMCVYCLRIGAALVMLGRARFEAAHALRVAAESWATYLVGVPTNVIRLLGVPGLDAADLGCLRATASPGPRCPTRQPARGRSGPGPGWCPSTDRWTPASSRSARRATPGRSAGRPWAASTTAARP